MAGKRTESVPVQRHGLQLTDVSTREFTGRTVMENCADPPAASNRTTVRLYTSTQSARPGRTIRV